MANPVYADIITAALNNANDPRSELGNLLDDVVTNTAANGPYQTFTATKTETASGTDRRIRYVVELVYETALAGVKDEPA